MCTMEELIFFQLMYFYSEVKYYTQVHLHKVDGSCQLGSTSWNYKMEGRTLNTLKIIENNHLHNSEKLLDLFLLSKLPSQSFPN